MLCCSGVSSLPVNFKTFLAIQNMKKHCQLITPKKRGRHTKGKIYNIIPDFYPLYFETPLYSKFNFPVFLRFWNAQKKLAKKHEKISFKNFYKKNQKKTQVF